MWGIWLRKAIRVYSRQPYGQPTPFIDLAGRKVELIAKIGKVDGTLTGFTTSLNPAWLRFLPKARAVLDCHRGSLRTSLSTFRATSRRNPKTETSCIAGAGRRTPCNFAFPNQRKCSRRWGTQADCAACRSAAQIVLQIRRQADSSAPPTRPSLPC